MTNKPMCCFIVDHRTGVGCTNAAEFTLWAGDGGRPENYTETCSLHISNLMTDAYIHHILPIETTRVTRD